MPLAQYRQNLFWIYLIDRNGNSVSLASDSFSITHGLSISGAPIPHSIGVAVSKNGAPGRFGRNEVFERLIDKGAILPAKKTETYKTIRALKRNENDNPLWIRVGEGESEIPDRNAFVCELGIKGSDLPQDLPEGTEVQITIAVNEMRELFVTAYLPLIDLTLNARSTIRDELIDIDEVGQELDGQITRARAVAQTCSNAQFEKIQSAIHAVSSSLQNAQVDEDEKRKAVKQVRDLKVALDAAEQENQLAYLEARFSEGVDTSRAIISHLQDPQDRTKFTCALEEIVKEGKASIARNDKTLLQGVNQRLTELMGRAYYANPLAWADEFRDLASKKTFTNAQEAARLVQRGQAAIATQDFEEVKRCCRALSALLPLEFAPPETPSTSGITR